MNLLTNNLTPDTKNHDWAFRIEDKMKKVLVTRQFPEPGLTLLENQGFKLTRWARDRPMTPEELIENCRGHQALFCTVTDAIDQNFLDQSRHLDIISQFAVGHDNIDVDHAASLGIPVGNTPDVMTEATADIAFGLMIATVRKMFFNNRGLVAWIVASLFVTRGARSIISSLTGTTLSTRATWKKLAKSCIQQIIFQNLRGEFVLLLVKTLVFWLLINLL